MHKENVCSEYYNHKCTSISTVIFVFLLPKPDIFYKMLLDKQVLRQGKINFANLWRIFYIYTYWLKNIDVTVECDIWTQISIFREMRFSVRSFFNLLCMIFAAYTLIFILQVFTTNTSHHKLNYKGKEKLFFV